MLKNPPIQGSEGVVSSRAILNGATKPFPDSHLVTARWRDSESKRFRGKNKTMSLRARQRKRRQIYLMREMALDDHLTDIRYRDKGLHTHTYTHRLFLNSVSNYSESLETSRKHNITKHKQVGILLMLMNQNQSSVSMNY